MLRVFSLNVRFAICAYVGDILRRRFTIILLKSSMEVVGAGIAQSDGYFGYGQPVLAQKFGGGGHARAAGCTIEGSLDEVKALILGAAGRALEGTE